MRTTIDGMCSKESGIERSRIFMRARASLQILALRVRPDGAGELDPPDRPAVKQRAFRFYERRSGALENPDVRIGRLLADQRRQESSEASDFGLDDIVCGAAAGTCNRKRLGSRVGDCQLHRTRIRG